MEFELQCSQKINSFIQLFDLISKMASVLKLNFDNNGIKFQTLDFEKITLLYGFFPKNWFNNYICKKNDSITINLQIFKLFLSNYKKDTHSTLKIIYDEFNNDKLNIQIFPSKNNAISQINIQMNLSENNEQEEYDLSLIDDNSYSYVVMSSPTFVEIISNLKNIKNDVRIVWNDEIVFSSENKEMGKIKQTINVDNVRFYGLVEDDDNPNYNKNVLYFSDSKMENMASFCKLSDFIELQMCPEKPIKAIYYLHNNIKKEILENDDYENFHIQNEYSAIFNFILSPKDNDYNDDL